MYYYALTLDKISKPALPIHYEDFIRNFVSEYPTSECEFHYEEGKQGRLHIHGMVKTPTKIYVNKLKRLAPSSDYNIQFVFVKNQVAWKAYIKKDINKETEILKKWKQEEYDFYHPLSDMSDQQSDAYSDCSMSEEYIEIPKIRTRIV